MLSSTAEPGDIREIRAQGVARFEVVGRASELSAFPQFLDDVEVGPAALVLEGDAGIGKTALWTRGVELGRERGYASLAARPAEAETQLPFSALGDLFGDIRADVLAALPDPQRRALDVALLRADAEEGGVERRAVALSILGVLRGLGERGPVVLAIDDLQWLDPASAAVLQFALRRLGNEPVGLLGARRGRGGELPSGLTQALSGDRVSRLEVGPLDRDSLRRLLVERRNLPLPRAVLLQLHRVSAGNPFLALEIARTLERRELQLVPGEPFPVPYDLRELVRERLEQLPDSAREAGIVVAALPQPSLERVREAADGLDELVAAGVVELDRERVRFTHPLLGSIIYSEASRERRRELHARLASLTADVEERARHLALAAAAPDAEIAAALDEAASRARQRGAPETAAELLEQAAALTPQDDEEHRFARLLTAAERHFEAGATERARDLFAVVAAEASDQGFQMRAGSWLGTMRVLTGDIAGAEVAFRHARSAAADPSLVPAGIEDGLSLVHEFRGDIVGAARHARAAVKLAELNGDRRELVRALAQAALYEARLGRRTAWSRIRRALALSREIEDLPVRADPSWIYAQLLGGRGDAEGACTIFRELRERALADGDEASLGIVLTGLCEAEIRVGRLAEAAAAAEEGHLSTLGTGQISQRIFMLKGVVLVAALQGRIDDARALAAEANDLIARTDFDPLLANMNMALGMLELSLGDAAGAHRTLAPLNRRVPTGRVRETGWFRFLADHLEALLALDELDAAQETLAKLEARRQTLLDRAWAVQASMRCRGLVEVASGNADDGIAALERAVRLSERGQEPFELARNLVALGRVQRRGKQRRTARESLVRAGEIFERLGMPLWKERANEELSRIGGRARRPGGLTETEARVARLAADGLTNREIAAALFLSVNTVQAYLKRIYRELGIRSRTELARKLPPSG